MVRYRFCKFKISVYIGIYTISNHFNGCFCHDTNIFALFAGSATEEGYNLCDIFCLVAL